MFEISAKTTFNAAHALRNYRGAAESCHDHEWICEAVVRVEGLDDSGCAVDFADIDVLLLEIVLPFRGKHINEVAPFDTISPSAENIARHIFDMLSKAIDSDSREVSRVTVWEDERHSASYLMSR